MFPPRPRLAALALLLVASVLATPAISAFAHTNVLGALPSGSVGAWQLTRRLNPDDAHEMGVSRPETGNWNPHHAFTTFGSALALDGDTMVVGTAPDACSPASWAYVFERDAANTWRQTAKLFPSDGHYADAVMGGCEGFGNAVAVDEHAGVIVVGNPGYTEPGGDVEQGSAYVFERAADGSWVEVQRFVGPDTGPDPGLPYDFGAHYGAAVAVDGDTIVVGAYSDDAAGRYTGSVYVYEREGSKWMEAGVFHGPGFRSFMGGSVAVRGGTIIAGASQETTEIGQYSGAVHVFERQGGRWQPLDSLLPPLPLWGQSQSSFGRRVALSEDSQTAVVGAPWSDELAGLNLGPQEETLNFGRAYVFERAVDEWNLVAELESPDPDAGATFGSAVGISGDTIVIGADWDSTDALAVGAAYAYERTPLGWTMVARLRGHDTGYGDFFGEEVAVSGASIVVSAPFDDNRGDGLPAPLDDEGDVPPCVHPTYMWGCDDGEDAGSVYIFDRIVEGKVP